MLPNSVKDLPINNVFNSCCRPLILNVKLILVIDEQVFNKNINLGHENCTKMNVSDMEKFCWITN